MHSNASNRLQLLIAVTVLFAIPPQRGLAQTSVDTARVAGWRSDIAYYLDQVKSRHYVYRNRPLLPGLIEAAARVSRNVPIYSDQRMLAEFEYLASFARRRTHLHAAVWRAQSDSNDAPVQDVSVH